MSVLPVNFAIFRFSGLWPPRNAPGAPGFRRWTRHFRAGLTFILVYYFTITGILELVFAEYDSDQFTDNLFLLLTMITLCLKMVKLLADREEIRTLVEMLDTNECQRRNAQEVLIQKKCDDVARFNTLSLAVLSESTVAGFVLIPLLNGGYRRGLLPFRSWLPYETSNIFVYSSTYVQQSITIALGASVNIAIDTLIAGMIIQACSQLDILKHRVSTIVEIPTSAEAPSPTSDIDARFTFKIKECIRHHAWIYQFTAKIQNIFSTVILFEFSVTILTLGISILQLSKVDADFTKIVSFSLYLSCMLIQLLLYCWYGNELRIKSETIIDALYNANWIHLSPATRKYCIVMMTRTERPVRIRCRSLLELSLSTYMFVLKTSFSAFNLLQKA